MNMTNASPAIQEYFDSLSEGFKKAYAQATQARARGLDPALAVEISPTADVAARVEALVGPANCAQRIRELCVAKSRESASFEIAKEIVGGKFDVAGLKEGGGINSPKRIEQAVRTGLALFTEGVVSAPIEGISQVAVKKNPDGSEFVAVYFAGPIRGAGGTGQAFALLLADYCRQVARISNYRPLQDEIDRYVEECNLYARKTRAGQYVPTEEEIKHIVNNCAVCIDGEPTEKYEVANHRNIQSVPSNRVRSGIVLVISEGVCLKASKVIKIAKRAGLDWSWAEKLVKIVKQDASKVEIKPSSKYMDEIVAGRPIFSYPMRPGGFRLRYGRTPFTGIAAKAIHPATMVVLDEFPVIGTQLKVERPGKGCIVTPCETILGPVVKLKNGAVKQIDSAEQAKMFAPLVQEILFLGDLLVNYGDFSKANHLLVPSGCVEEWYCQELRDAGEEKTVDEARQLTAPQALKLAVEKKVSLAPQYTYFYHDVDARGLKELAEWLCTGKAVFEWFEFRGLRVPIAPQKRIAELLCVPHEVEGNEVVFDANHGLALATTLGLLKEKRLVMENFCNAYGEDKDAMQVVNGAAGFLVRRKAGIYIGSSMGRPEKAKPRHMKPPVHSLFPIGMHGGKMRSVVKAVRTLESEGNRAVETELSFKKCGECNTRTWKNVCPSCGGHTQQVKRCSKCGKMFSLLKDYCECGGAGALYDKQSIELSSEYKAACEKVKCRPTEMKAVQGLISPSKTPEPIEKGILRAKHGITVFRDGTTRFDATEVPATHFSASDANITVEQLKSMGYTHDVDGKALERDYQVVELKPQDVIIAEDGVDFLLATCAFLDDLLVYYYNQPPYYNASKREDLLGQLGLALAPHTSAGTLCRIVGFSQVKAIVAHPYLHCACRRNCDGDELCLILLMDGLLNFSKSYLPATRGGQMDAPLVLSVKLDPGEVDDEVHAMDVCWQYPKEFYESTLKNSSPSEVKIETVASRLGSPSQFEGFGFTHKATLQGPTHSSYTKLGSMHEKVDVELELMKRIRAVDAKGAAERIILAHFFPDLYGNLRSFSRQSFRCVDCNAKYRRVPLVGKCDKCGGKLLLTINKGGIEKYLNLSKEMAEKYNLPNYLKQRLVLLEKEIDSIFENEQVKQFNLADYV